MNRLFLEIVLTVKKKISKKHENKVFITVFWIKGLESVSSLPNKRKIIKRNQKYEQK